MRIELQTYFKKRKANYLNGKVLIKNGEEIREAEFIIDTGSTVTILNSDIAKRLNISVDKLEKEGAMGMSGGKHEVFLCRGIKFLFLTDNGRVKEEEISVRILKQKGDLSNKDFANIPTILGTDFLNEKEYELFCSFSKGEAFLEKDSEFFTAA